MSISNELVASIFKALSNATRIQILLLIKEQPLCVCEIVEKLGLEQSAVSQHLAVLRNQGIVDSKKDGLMVIYSIRSREIYHLLDIAEDMILKQLDETREFLINERSKK